jgi:hypothetical protein
MLKYIKKRRVAKNPPTTKQRQYAKALNVQVSDYMTRADLSAAIARAEKANPKLVSQLEQAKLDRRKKRYGAEAIEIESYWNHLCDNSIMALLVFQRGKDTIVDAVEISGAEFDKNKKIKLQFYSPKLKNDRHLGEILEWERSLVLRPNKIIYHEKIEPEINFDDLLRYERLVERGLKIAKDLQR